MERTDSRYEESSKTRSQFATGEKWMLNNAKRFDDPAKFKAAYIKTIFKCFYESYH